MPSWLDVATCAAAATLFWTILGLALGRPLLPKPLALGFAPTLGLAAHSAVMLPVHTLIGFSPLSVRIAAAIILAASLVELGRRRTFPSSDPTRDAAVPAWAWPGAALVATAVAIAILPKDSGAVLASPIFDHAKVAIIDEIARLGVPPGNPFFGPPGVPTRLPYYYLWHFTAAELALLANVSGWTADAALTGVTAFSSMMAMIGLAVWWSGRSVAALLALGLALTGSLRPLIELVVARPDLDSWFLEASGLGSWLFQATWVPQHLAAAGCVILAVVLIAQLPRAPLPWRTVMLALVAAAAVQSSTYVGGVTFAIAAPIIAVMLLNRIPPRQRMPFGFAAVLAALAAVALAFPMLREQWAAATAARNIATPIVIMPTEVFGPEIPEALRRILDLPGFWLLYLVVELPAIYLVGALSLRLISRGPADDDRARITLALVGLAATGLTVSWLLVSTFGNNDLGWRASLPPIMVLLAASAAGLGAWLRGRWKIAAIAALVAGLPSGALTIQAHIAGNSPRSEVFRESPAMWEALRQLTGPAARIANNPQFLQEMTPWRANISWALLADRRSCFAGDDLVLAFVPLPHSQRRYIDTTFIRLFSGEMPPEDVVTLLARFGCEAVVLTAQDGAWSRDPFPAAGFRLAAQQAGAWRIYVRVDVASSDRRVR